MFSAFLGRYWLWPSLAGLPIRTKEGFVMTSLSTPHARGKNEFTVIADSFLHDPGLPFASVLDAEAIRRVFQEEEDRKSVV